MANPLYNETPVNHELPISSNPEINALIMGSHWGTLWGEPIDLSYSFPSGTAWFTNWYGEGEWESGWYPLTSMQRDAFRLALAVFEQVASITFIEVADNQYEVGEIRVGLTELVDIDGSSAWAYLPGQTPEAGDIWLSPNHFFNSDLHPGGFEHNTLLHELGHALGLVHPFAGSSINNTTLPGGPLGTDNIFHTVMSYTSDPSGAGRFIDRYPTTLMTLDIQALQYLYGANGSHNSGDTVYTFSETGEYFETLWDGGGFDVIDYSSAHTGAIINLMQGTWSSLGQPVRFFAVGQVPQEDPRTVWIAYDTQIEGAIGSHGNDVIVGNSLNNNLSGNSGDDLFIDMGGNNFIHGGPGIDTLVLPMLSNRHSLSSTAGEQWVLEYGSNRQELLSVEVVEFGVTGYQTSIPLTSLLNGEVQQALGLLADLYLAFFGRAPDLHGLEFWQEQLLEHKLSFQDIAWHFASSEEARQLFPVDVDNRQFVGIVYENVFGRAPEETGWEFWTDVLDTTNRPDAQSRGLFVAEVIFGAYADSSGPADRSYLAHRHDIALYYTNQLALRPEEPFDPAIDRLLQMVSADPASHAGAEAIIDHALSSPVTLAGVLDDPALFDTIWAS